MSFNPSHCLYHKSYRNIYAHHSSLIFLGNYKGCDLYLMKGPGGFGGGSAGHYRIGYIQKENESWLNFQYTLLHTFDLNIVDGPILYIEAFYRIIEFDLATKENLLKKITLNFSEDITNNYQNNSFTWSVMPPTTVERYRISYDGSLISMTNNTGR